MQRCRQIGCHTACWQPSAPAALKRWGLLLGVTSSRVPLASTSFSPRSCTHMDGCSTILQAAPSAQTSNKPPLPTQPDMQHSTRL